ncbi:hypothetical protein [Antrihabitans cavernicola]|uniref:Uncharacterized protein n=1 Tax=Antrihabitans cavernicola TaxID=2495913 RepID=A0A5A7SKC6_9NOCA|nr:hypothetical protein [Spelaeibacter cavernicola]KAA0024915.1 hypothetical protein FOY51_03045 [Spelaeibacter cavernicola]
MEAILFVAIFIGGSYLYYAAKQRAKRKVFFKHQYDSQRSLTHRNLVITTTADIKDVRRSLDRHVVSDDSARAVFFGGAIKVQNRSDLRTVYQHSSKITSGGDGDHFSASITFRPPKDDHLSAVISIDQWREKDGVTRRAGIKAMQQFMDSVVAAFRAADPNIQIKYTPAA